MKKLLAILIFLPAWLPVSAASPKASVGAFDLAHNGTFPQPKSYVTDAVRVACKMSNVIDVNESPMFAMFDIDSDGTPEYFVKDAKGNKGVAVLIDTRYQAYPLGFFKTNITLMPSLISASTSAGPGIVTNGLYAINGSQLVKSVTQILQAINGTDDMKATYEDGTEADFLMLSDRVDGRNQIDFEALNWRHF